MKNQTILITGATAGIGRATALYLAQRGHHVIATGRRQAELDRLVTEAGPSLRISAIALDVTNPESIAAAVTSVDTLTNGAGLDALVNNAGFGVMGPLSELSDADLRRQYDTNVFGLMAVTRAFLPAMRERARGSRAGARIVNVSSIGGRVTFPFMGAYNSTKYALESLSDALRYELAPFGIAVSLIEPGVIRTEFAETAMSPVSRFESSVYGPAIAKADVLRQRMEATAVGPDVVARAIHKALTARRPAARYVAPRFGHLLLAMLAVTPTCVADALFRRMSFLSRRELAPPA
ncbi:MAG: SDR family oxidoreductase [Myxococcales bacterium]|nr:SDR family oxidoreductase [Myxococcales bacterium]